MNQFVSSTLAPLCIIVVLCSGLVYSQDFTYGVPSLCLLSRTDVINCNFVVASTPRPATNEFGIYSTRIRPGPAGLPTCRIRRRKHQIRKIETLGDDERVKFIFSPGMRLENPADYANQMIVFYNIRCPAGHIAFLNLTRITTEEPFCFDAASNTSRCVDYVQVNRGGFGTTETCGNTPSEDNMNQLQEGPLDITFRTSDRNRFEGFEASVVCFRREEGNLPGCTRPGENSTDTNMTSANSRKKRDLDDFNNEWKRRLESIKRMRRQTGPGGIFLRFEEINVNHGVAVFYENDVITFINPENNREIREAIKNIIVLHTFDANGTTVDFKKVAETGSGALIPLLGPGPMKILGQYAYFQLFVVDPRGILPNPVEMSAINNLTQAQFDLVTEDNSTRLDNDFVNPTPIDDVNALGRQPRIRRQTESKVGDDALMSAIMNENACNAILRRLALATIENEDPDVVDNLRNQMAGPG